MKLKAIVSSMAVLGLISTTAFAATQPARSAADNTGYLSQDAYWMNIINRNQDNAYLVVQPAGSTKLSAFFATDYVHNQKRTGYSIANGNGNGSNGIFVSPEVYFDAQVNNWTGVHLALESGPNTNRTFSYTQDTTAPTLNSTFGTTQIFFDEAYATFTYNNFFAKVGQQYANFGTTMKNSITATLPQQLAAIDQTGVMLGAVSAKGFYGDVFIYQGSAYGNVNGNDYSEVNRNGSVIHGYTLDAGYALNLGQNAFYGNNGGNVYIDYIANLADSLTLESTIYTNNTVNSSNVPNKQVPGVAVHADYATGPFQVMVDYVSALAGISSVTYNNSAAKPSAYGLQGSYSWNPNMVQTLTLGYGATQESLGITPFAGGTNLPSYNLLASYSISPIKNVKLRLDYIYSKDYDTDTAAQVGSSNATYGTGDANNTVDARIQVLF
jgi:hypothetical protein